MTSEKPLHDIPEEHVENQYPNFGSLIIAIDPLEHDLMRLSSDILENKDMHYVTYDSSERVAAAAERVAQAIVDLRAVYEAALKESKSFRTPR